MSNGKCKMVIRCKKLYASVLTGKSVRVCEKNEKTVLELLETETH